MSNTHFVDDDLVRPLPVCPEPGAWPLEALASAPMSSGEPPGRPEPAPQNRPRPRWHPDARDELGWG